MITDAIVLQNQSLSNHKLMRSNFLFNLQADATHNRGPVRQDTPMPTEAPPAYEEEDKASKTA